MKNKLHITLFLLLTVLAKSWGVNAYRGELDLTAHTRDLEETVTLKGEWEVFWNNTYLPGDSLPKPDAYISFEKPWNYTAHFAGKEHAFGYATYRLNLILPKSADDLSMAIPKANSAFNLYVNGKLIYKNGRVANTQNDYRPDWDPSIRNIPVQHGSNEILIQVANFDHHSGGFMEPLVIGPSNKLYFNKNLSLGGTLFFVGKLLVCAFLAFGLYWYNLKNKGLLLLATSSLLLILHLLSSYDEHIRDILPGLPWFILVRLEVPSLMAALGLYALFCKRFFRNSPRKNTLLYGMVALSAIMVLSAGLPTPLFTMLTPYYYYVAVAGIIILSISYLNRANWNHRNTWFSGLGVGALMLMVLFKGLFYSGVTSYPIITISIFLLVFIVTQLLIILQEFGHSIKEMNERGEIAETTQKDFLNVISHELRTPLNAIMGMSDMLDKTELNPQQRDKLNTLRKNGDDLNSLLMDILSMSEIHRKTLKLDKRPLNLVDIIDESIKLSKKELGNKPVQFGRVVPEDLPPTLVGDGSKIRQILRHLLSNAFKFTREGEVIFTCQVAEQTNKKLELRFVVSDTGIGMSKNQLMDVFDPFNQGERGNTRAFGGTGLGLTVSKQMAELMGGTLDITSKKGEGTTVVFTVRLDMPRLNIITEEQKLIKDDVDTNLKILYAEDNPVNQKLLSMMIKTMGIDIETAANGKIAWEMALTNQYNIILMDVQMPVMDGIEATKRIIADVRNRPIIVAVTANAGAADKMRCVEAGMNDFMAKPIKADELKHMLIKWQGLREYLDDESSFMAG